MILYNVRHRGNYEYEKFALNIFQFYNEIIRLNKLINETSKKSLAEKITELDLIIDKFTEQLGEQILFFKLETENQL